MYVVIAEDKTDINCLKILIQRLDKEKWIKKNPQKPIENYMDIFVEGKGFSGCGNLLKEGAKFLNAYNGQNKYQKIIICHDKDKASKEEIYNKVVSKIVKPANLKNKSTCIVIPIEEIEAWILADIQAVTQVISSWKPSESFVSPEAVANPKEKLIKLSQIRNSKPLYDYATHNKKIMEHLDLETLKKKCPSFVELAQFVENGIANYPV